MRTRDLHCTAGCREGSFEIVGTPVIVDSTGRYLQHDDSRATFVCTLCGNVAVDLAAIPNAIRADREIEQATLQCPACGVLMLPPEDGQLATEVECPGCGAVFAFEEGLPRLFGATPDFTGE